MTGQQWRQLLHYLTAKTDSAMDNTRRQRQQRQHIVLQTGILQILASRKLIAVDWKR